MIPLQGKDVASQIIGADLVDRFLIAEELHKAVEHGLVLSVGIWLLERLDLCEVLVNGDVQRWRFRSLAGEFEPRNAEFSSFQFMRFRRWASSACAAVTPADSRRRCPPARHSIR